MKESGTDLNADATTPAVKRGRWWYARLPLVLAVGLVAAFVVTSVTVDVGPALHGQVEQIGSRQVGRPMHIRKLSVYLFLGRFLAEDLVIEGPTPDDRPFLRADRIVVSMPWSSLFRGEILFDSIEITDWELVLESFPDGRHTFPDLDGDPVDIDDATAASSPDNSNLFVTTLSYIRAQRGTVIFDDYGSNWSAVTPNFDITVTKLADYRGQVTFSNGTVQIGTYEPITASVQAEFGINGSDVMFDRLDLETNGTISHLVGKVDIANWPEQHYEVQSEGDLGVLRDIFFAHDPFTVGGMGHFGGTYHKYENGYDLRGDFRSDLATINEQPFLDLSGSLRWRNDDFDVFDASSIFHDGPLQFEYALMSPDLPGGNIGRLDLSYRNVDLLLLTDKLALAGIRLQGQSTGWNRMSWPRGHFQEHKGEGHIEARPPEGIQLQAELINQLVLKSETVSSQSVRRFSVGGSASYRLGPEWIDLAVGSWVATPRTRIVFEGRTAYGDDSEIPFNLTSADWQETDQILAGVMTAFGELTNEFEISGRGTFDGVIQGPISSPLISGVFAAEGLRLWDVMWGRWTGEAIIENGYYEITDGQVTDEGSEIKFDGRFAFSYPRTDGDEEMNATFRITDRRATDFLTAFEQEGYRIEGLLSGELHVYGDFAAPFGFGQMSMRNGTAYGEPVESGVAGLRFEGTGVRLDGVEMVKGGGVVTGAAFVNWLGTYTFNADGFGIPMSEVATVENPYAPLSGTLQFTASGVGAFETPNYDVRGRVDSLFMSEEEIGQVTGRIGVRNEELEIEIEAASPRLAISALGRVALTVEGDAELAFRFTDTALDPYIRIFEPRLQPYTTILASGSTRIVGELSNPEHLLIDMTIEQLQLGLFDYELRNEGDVRIALDQEVVRIEQMQLGGEGTALDLAGEIRLQTNEVAIRATGDANLGILQGFIGDIRSSGSAELVAEIRGSIDVPVLDGYAAVTDGRLRLFSLPHSLEAVNGRAVFDADGIHLDDLSATLGGGLVQFGGRIGLDGYLPGELDMTLTGQGMQLRYPEGIRSVIDADLSLQGSFEDPVLVGAVEVVDATWVRQFELDTQFLNFSAQDEIYDRENEIDSAFPIRYDLQINAPGTLRIEDKNARVTASVDLRMQGTAQHPQLLGYIEVDRGEVFFEGNRYFVTSGSLDFSDPTTIDPFFDVEAETSVRVPGQIYRVIFHAAGTAGRFVPDLTSDPPLPAIDILALLLGSVHDPAEGELRALRTGTETDRQLLQARAAQLLTNPISSGFGQVVEESLGVDSFQIGSSLSDATSRQTAALTSTARLTIGKRVSDRAYLTLSRALTGGERDLLILLEYDQSDRLSWVLSQNEDRTYAIDFRVRHAF